jgi:hypothetical protein
MLSNFLLYLLKKLFECVSLEVAKTPFICKGHRDALLITRFDNFLILDTSSWLNTSSYSKLSHEVNTISEWEKTVTRQH